MAWVGAEVAGPARRRATARTTASSSPALGSAHVDGVGEQIGEQRELGGLVGFERAGPIAGDQRLALFVRPAGQSWGSLPEMAQQRGELSVRPV